MTDLRARARKAADLIIDGLLDRAQFPVIPTSEREHSADVVAAALAEQIEADARIAEDEDGHFSQWGEDRNTRVAQATCRRAATAIREQEKG